MLNGYSLYSPDLLRFMSQLIRYARTYESGVWPYAVTPSTDQPLYMYELMTTRLDIVNEFDHLRNLRVFNRNADRGRILLRAPGLVPFGTWIFFNIYTSLSKIVPHSGHVISNILLYFFLTFSTNYKKDISNRF